MPLVMRHDELLQAVLRMLERVFACVEPDGAAWRLDLNRPHHEPERSAAFGDALAKAAGVAKPRLRELDTVLPENLNVLPTDAAWLKLGDKLAEDVAAQLKCMVVMVAMQEQGKASFCVGGQPEAGPLHELGEDLPRFFATCAGLIKVARQRDDRETRQ